MGAASVAAAAMRYRPPEQTRTLVRLYRAQGGRCPRCGCRFPPLDRYHPHEHRAPTFDHVHPRSKGGTRKLGNVLLLHKHCNEAKADAPPTGCELVWLGVVNARLGVDAGAVQYTSALPVISIGGSQRESVAEPLQYQHQSQAEG